MTPEALVAVLETRRPQRLLLRRFKQPKPVLTAIASFYTELPFAAGPTTRNKPPQLYARADDPVPRDSSAGQALLATTNALRKLSHSGGFAAHYNLRTGETWGEGRKAEPMDRGTIKVQPPGSTQEVGQCFLRAKRVTGAALFWEAAQEAGRALACAQRPDGGWASVAHLAAPCKARGEPRADSVATLDEGATQLAIAFRMDLAAVYATKPHPQPAWLDPSIKKDLDFLVSIQKKDGGWPQQHPKTKVAYAAYATLNDGVTSEAIAVLLRGHRILGDERYLDAAMRGGDFLNEVQGAPPQAGWAQQYGPDNRPAAARSFEPAAYGSEESGFALNALIDLYVATGDERFLRGLDAARDWLERSAIRPGVWSRLYEVGTNRPIYGDRDGKVHYSLAKLSEERRTGYRWEAAFPSVTRALGRYSALTAGGLDGLRRYEQEAERDKRRRLYAEATPLVEEIASRAVPGQGWVENDILSTPTFITNCDVLLNSLEVAGSDAGQL